jgi:hypothetical protein
MGLDCIEASNNLCWTRDFTYAFPVDKNTMNFEKEKCNPE